MQTLNGKSVYGGIAIGKIEYLETRNVFDFPEKSDDTEKELDRFAAARNTASEELKELYRKALDEVGKENAEIFQVHKVVLEDPDYLESVCRRIREEMCSAEYAVFVTGAEYAEKLLKMEDEYTQERAGDIRDVSERLIKILEGAEAFGRSWDEPVILLADDLSPSQTIQLDKNKILALVTKYGSRHSHTAILARSMGIPALVCVDFPEKIKGKSGLVDGFEGIFYLEPDEPVLDRYRTKQQQEREKRELLKSLKGKKNITKDGKEIQIYANIGSVADIADVIANDAGGIGLFRSELMFMEKNRMPDEDEQFHTYRAVARGMKGKKVIIRTLDIGADKHPSYLKLEKEENPAMGCRGIRLCLSNPELFKTQLKAIFRASNYGNLSVMYPMITSIEELEAIQKMVEEVKEQLRKKGIPFRDIFEGIMIETPAAAIMADELAERVDFFSIGTNDLTQYVLAMDRQNEKMEAFFNPYHKAVLKLIEHISRAGHKKGCQVGICGELAGDLKLTETFVELGIDELSVAPDRVLPLRKRIREI